MGRKLQITHNTTYNNTILHHIYNIQIHRTLIYILILVKSIASIGKVHNKYVINIRTNLRQTSGYE